MTLTNGIHDGKTGTLTPVVDAIKEIKHDAGHDINRMARMIYDLRQLCDEHTEAASARHRELAETRKQQEFECQELARVRADLTQTQRDLTNQKRIIENQQEEIANLHDTIRAKEVQLINQCQATTDIALQLSISRRDHAAAEQSHRETVQANAQEMARLHQALQTFEKVKSLGSKYRVECAKLLQENNELVAKINSKVIWRRIKERLMPRWLTGDEMLSANEKGFDNG